jgi:hypothetical protein
MKAVYAVALAGLALAAAGCGGSPPDQPGPVFPTTPLTVAEWRALPKETKYLAENLDRVKAGNRRLATKDGWQRFYRTELEPAMKKDFPAAGATP